MALIKPDFSEVQDSVGPGTYTTRIVDATVGEWQGKDGKPNTPYIAWSLETFGEEDSKNNGRRIFHRTPIAGRGAFRFRDLYKAAMKEDLKAAEFDSEMLLGREVRVTVVDGMTKDGNPTGYTEVKSVMPL